MEIRLPRLEEDMREVKIDLKALRVDVNDLRTDVAGLKGRMSGIEARLGQIPTTWQTFSFTLTLMGDVFAIVRYGVSH